MKKNLRIAILMTLVTTVLLGVIYPLVVTAVAQIFFPEQANGQLLKRDGVVVGSSLIGQGFSGPAYFHSRPSATTIPYDAANSGGSNLGPTNQKLIDRVREAGEALRAENENQNVPIDLLTTSASGFDPHITPTAAAFQVERVARARGIAPPQLKDLVLNHTEGRQFGVLGEARVNVLELNLDLDKRFPVSNTDTVATRR